MPATADRVEITELFARLGHLLDDRRWDDAGEVFAEDIVGRSPRGEINGLTDMRAFLHRTEPNGELSQHIATDIVVDFTGDDAATGTANSTVHYFREGEAPHRTAGLRMTCEVARTGSGWRFREYGITLLWLQGE
ncbi:nuclear transport factor 2 family protein [Phytomonospora endophytica]|uniref:SnoaL-like domain-containing protein n=1 Tax=Phytomonospora endophytica TaxID=714109 RepID=A0A841FMA6_9ACTN|nr:nuclear transport factor 2 family protein [Phytomonospora endophytica]MBB6036043.1 hypothetical protein [Phytomonospora endophytica]GIG66948.1 hypothetical protein Pen01_32430 [Phytomonospora endophytica]